MKLLLRIVVAMILTMTSLATYAYDFEVDKVYYSILSDTECGVAGSNGTLTNVIIPEKVYGYTVTEVISGPTAKTVALPSTLKKIHYQAFYNSTSLESIVIPDGVEYIGILAFSGCTSLRSIKLPASLKVLEESCFSRCSVLSEIDFPENLIEIRHSAFGTGDSFIPWLTNQPEGPIYVNDIFVSYNGDPYKIEIKDGTKSIAGRAFMRTPNVEEISIPSSVYIIGEDAFLDTKWFAKQSLPLYINNVLVLGDGSENFIIPNFVTSIAGNAFVNKSSLKNVVIPNSVKYIGRCAFYGCENLTTVDIPESVTVIGRSPFGNCTSLTSINVDENNPAYCSYNGLLYNNNCDSLIQHPGGKVYNTSLGDASLLSNKTRYICFEAISTTYKYKDRYFPKTVSYIDQFNLYRGQISKAILPCRATGCINIINADTEYPKIYNYSTQSSIQVYNSQPSGSSYTIYHELNAEVYNRTNTSRTYSDARTLLQNSYLPNAIIRVKDSYSTNHLIDFVPDSYFFKIGTNWIAINYRLLDGEPFYCPEQMVASKITYTREFNNDDWQALFLPYSLAYDEWKDLGEVAELANVGLNAANEPVLIWQRITEGELLPNHPYIFKPNETGEMIFIGENKTIMPTGNTDIVSYTADGVVYSLSGIYQEKTNMATTHAYALSGGDFRPTDSNSKTLKPFRIYLTINSGSQKAPQRVRNIIADDNDLSGIQIITVPDNTESTYYDLMGRKIENPSNGIYIKDNKKVIIK